jgi:hypothetical protein
LFTRRRLYLEKMREALPFLGVRTAEKGWRSKSVQGRGRISLWQNAEHCIANLRSRLGLVSRLEWLFGSMFRNREDVSVILFTRRRLYVKITIHIPKKSRIAHTGSSQDAGLSIAGCTFVKRDTGTVWGTAKKASAERDRNRWRHCKERMGLVAPKYLSETRNSLVSHTCSWGNEEGERTVLRSSILSAAASVIMRCNCAVALRPHFCYGQYQVLHITMIYIGIEFIVRDIHG